jgi:hypothetical protein
MDVIEPLILIPTKVYITCNDLSTLIILLVHFHESVIEVTDNSSPVIASPVIASPKVA